ncbi:rCG57446 [Rattus norvegicus]|uniref:RCG57446 n=1 Tax=Rattus norvegicus TaxID=10116 RepID=A6JHS8_RAT|nr:rCG57446 [Rattus norvegicus]
MIYPCFSLEKPEIKVERLILLTCSLQNIIIKSENLTKFHTKTSFCSYNI